jgi:SAM-dependent methyltransferase
MLRQIDDVLAFMQGLSVASWTATAIGVLFESGIVDALSEPRTPAELASRCPSLTANQIRRCLDVAVANGLATRDGERYRLVEAAVPLLVQPLRSIVPADVRSTLMQGLSFLDSAQGERPRVGWRHQDERVLRGQGEGSAMIVRMLQRRVVPELEGLAERIGTDDARFLDIGVRVAALAVEMCRTFPKLHAVGLDVHEPALALARETVARANMNDRIELRKLPVEDLKDESAFDLVWLPSFFIPTVRAATTRIRDALRPGGWVVCALVGAGGDEEQNAVWALIGETWGGELLTPAEAVVMLRAGGFSIVRELPSPSPGVAFVVARR